MMPFVFFVLYFFLTTTGSLSPATRGVLLPSLTIVAALTPLNGGEEVNALSSIILGKMPW